MSRAGGEAGGGGGGACSGAVVGGSWLIQPLLLLLLLLLALLLLPLLHLSGKVVAMLRPLHSRHRGESERGGERGAALGGRGPVTVGQGEGQGMGTGLVCCAARSDLCG